MIDSDTVPKVELQRAIDQEHYTLAVTKDIEQTTRRRTLTVIVMMLMMIVRMIGMMMIMMMIVMCLVNNFDEDTT